MIQKIKDFFKRIKLKRIAIVSVMVAQSLKRIVNSEVTLMLIDLAPLPWVKFFTKLFGYLKRVDAIVPELISNLVVANGMLEKASEDKKLAVNIFIDHLRHYDKDRQNEMYKLFATKVFEALSDDGEVDAQETDQILEEIYQELFKKPPVI
jgi:hypothetical protein